MPTLRLLRHGVQRDQSAGVRLRRVKAHAPNAPANRLVSDGTYWYAYDAEGNRTARFIDVDQSGTLSTNDTNVTKYAWDGRNRLIGVADYAVEGSRAVLAFAKSARPQRSVRSWHGLRSSHAPWARSLGRIIVG